MSTSTGLAVLILLTMSTLGCASALRGDRGVRADELRLEIFVSEPIEVNVTSALIMGPTEMLVVCGQATRSAAIRLADEIAEQDRTLKYVYLTHPHMDHSQGASILLERFPGAKFIAVPEVAALQRETIEFDDQLARFRHRENAAVPSIPATDYTDSTITIDGHTIEIWKDIVGDGGLGAPHTALYIPSLEALLPSDSIYFDAHVMLAGSTPESRAAAIEQIEGWIARDFKTVVPGHMPKGAPLTAMGALTHTRDYIRSYDEVVASHSKSDDVIRAMFARYPDTRHESALIISTFLNFGEMDRVRAYLGTWREPGGANLQLK